MKIAAPYAGIMRYAGVSSAATVARALKQLARLHAIEIHRGSRMGVTRTCSAYRVTIEDPKFVDWCNEVFQMARAEIAQEREYRHGLRSKRAASLQGRNKSKEKPSTCEGLDLSSVSEVNANKTLQGVKREIDLKGVHPCS